MARTVAAPRGTIHEELETVVRGIEQMERAADAAAANYLKRALYETAAALAERYDIYFYWSLDAWMRMTAAEIREAVEWVKAFVPLPEPPKGFQWLRVPPAPLAVRFPQPVTVSPAGCVTINPSPYRLA